MKTKTPMPSPRRHPKQEAMQARQHQHRRPDLGGHPTDGETIQLHCGPQPRCVSQDGRASFSSARLERYDLAAKCRANMVLRSRAHGADRCNLAAAHLRHPWWQALADRHMLGLAEAQLRQRPPHLQIQARQSDRNWMQVKLVLGQKERASFHRH